jgi:molecular chaperone DnaK (HSP70)
MVKDAEANAEDDKRRELVEARNQAEALAHSSEKSLKEYGDKVSEADRTAIAMRSQRCARQPRATTSRISRQDRRSPKLR